MAKPEGPLVDDPSPCWIPIDEAPRDGTVVLLMCEHQPDIGIHLMFWDEQAKKWSTHRFGRRKRTGVSWDWTHPPTHFMEVVV